MDAIKSPPTEISQLMAECKVSKCRQWTADIFRQSMHHSGADIDFFFLPPHARDSCTSWTIFSQVTWFGLLADGQTLSVTKKSSLRLPFFICFQQSIGSYFHISPPARHPFRNGTQMSPFPLTSVQWSKCAIDESSISSRRTLYTG